MTGSPTSRATGIRFSRRSRRCSHTPPYFFPSPHHSNTPQSRPPISIPLLDTMEDTIETAQRFIYVLVFLNTPISNPHSFSSTQVYFCCKSIHLALNRATDTLHFPLGMCESLFLHTCTSLLSYTHDQQTPSSCGTGSSAFRENGVSYVTFLFFFHISFVVPSDLEDNLDPS